MPQVNINLMLTGFYAFLIAVLIIGSWSIVTLAISGVVAFQPAWYALGALTLLILVIGILTYIHHAVD